MASWLSWDLVSTSPSQIWGFIWFELLEVSFVLPQSLSLCDDAVSLELSMTSGSYALSVSSS